MPDQIAKLINEHVLEIRYRPNAKVLDYRGAWAESISDHLDLPHWRIVQNRIDIYNEGQAIRAFIGFRNGGLTVLDSPTKNYFPDLAGKLFRYVFQLEGFDDPILVERIGARSKFCTPFAGSFDELKSRFAERYLSITEKAQEAIGDQAKLVDIGAPLNFADQFGNFNTLSGPMSAEQFPAHFTRDEGFPDVGLFYDIDYWLRPNEELTSRRVIGHISEFAVSAWERHARIRDLLLED